MKASLVSLRVYEGFMDWSHGGGFTQYRLLIPEVNNLLVWTHGKLICFEEGFEGAGPEDPGTIREVEVPDDFVKELLNFKRTQEVLHGKLDELLQ